MISGTTPQAAQAECVDVLGKFEPRIKVTNVQPTVDANGKLLSVTVHFVDVQDSRADSVLIEYKKWTRK